VFEEEEEVRDPCFDGHGRFSLLDLKVFMLAFLVPVRDAGSLGRARS